MTDLGQEQLSPMGEGIQLLKRPEDAVLITNDGDDTDLLTPKVDLPNLGVKYFQIGIQRFSQDETIDFEINENYMGVTIDQDGEIIRKPLREMMKEGYGVVELDGDTDHKEDSYTVDIWQASFPGIKVTTQLTTPFLNKQEIERDPHTDLFPLSGGGRSVWKVPGPQPEDKKKDVFVVRQQADSLMELRLSFRQPLSSQNQKGVTNL